MSELRGAQDLEVYLAAMRQEGQFDSSGRFTIGSQEKLRKMGDLARANAIRWLFYGVQSAVLSGGERCRLGCSRETASVAWELPSRPAWLTDLEAISLLAEDPELGEAYEHMRQALLWSLAQEPLRVSLVVEGPEGGFTLDYSQGQAQQKILPADPRLSATQIHLSFEPSEEDRRFRRPEVRGAFHAESSFRLAFCPMSVLFDGQQLSLGRMESLLRGKEKSAFTTAFKTRVKSLLLAHPRQQGESFLISAVRDHLEDFLARMQGQCRCLLLAPHLTSRRALALVHPRSLPANRYSAAGRHIKSEFSEQAADIEHYAFPQGQLITTATIPEGYLELQRSYGKQRLCLRTGLNCSSSLPGWERVFCDAVVARLGVTNNHVLVQQHGMLLDPIHLTLSEQGWVFLFDRPDLPVELTGYKAIQASAESAFSQLCLNLREQCQALVKN